MLMRYKPLRGEKHKLKDGTCVTIIEPISAFTPLVKVILPSGKMTTVDPSDIELPVIDTKSYEKIRNV